MKRSKVFAIGCLMGLAAVAALAIESNALFRVVVSEAGLSRETFSEKEAVVTTISLTNAMRTLDTIRLLNGVQVSDSTQCATIVSAAAPLTFANVANSTNLLVKSAGVSFSNISHSIYVLTNGASFTFPNVTNIVTILRSLSGVTVTNMTAITNLTSQGG